MESFIDRPIEALNPVQAMGLTVEERDHPPTRPDPRSIVRTLADIKVVIVLGESG